MTSHPYLRAYMAGITIPSVFLLLVFAVFCVIRFIYNPEFPIERAMVFPLALVPALWGFWNVQFLAMHRHRYLPLGAHGALVPLILAPIGLLVAKAAGFEHAVAASWPIVLLALPLVMILYYLVWKFLVGFLNGLLGIACD